MQKVQVDKSCNKAWAQQISSNSYPSDFKTIRKRTKL